MSKFATMNPVAATGPFSGMVAMMDSAGHQPAPQEITEKEFFDGVTEEEMFDAVTSAAVQAARADAMAMVIEWVADGDDSAESLDAYAQALADVDEDGEISGDEEDALYSEALTLMAEALAQLGVPARVASDAMEGDETASAKAFVAAGDYLDESEDDSDALISSFAVRETMMMDAVKKVIRNGKVKLIKKRLRKVRLSSAQKMALKKARRKAHTASARTARKKSLKIRKNRGM